MSSAWHGGLFITYAETEACWTRMLLRLKIASTSNQPVEIGFGWQTGKGFSDAGGINTRLVPLILFLSEKEFSYRFCALSALSRFDWPNCETQWFVGACARVIHTIQKVYIPNTVVRQPVYSISSCLLLSSEKVKTTSVLKFTNKI